MTAEKMEAMVLEMFGWTPPPNHEAEWSFSDEVVLKLMTAVEERCIAAVVKVSGAKYRDGELCAWHSASPTEFITAIKEN
jgi:hypothetical protein